MKRVNPAENFWERILVPYRARDWTRCLRELRPVLDADEDALVPRMLFAALHCAAEQPALALVQYETLLPLAVGQGDFLRALAVQKHLDALHPASVSHARRFEALQRWFSSLKPARSELRRADEVTLASLLSMEPGAFTQLAEAGVIEGLDPEPRTLENEVGSVRFVLFGRVQWSLTRGEVTLIEAVAGAGDVIAVNADLGDEVRLRIEAEWPAELLRLGPEVVALLTDPEAARAEFAPPAPAPPAPAAPAPVEAATPPPVPATAAPPAPAARPQVERPRPDPRFEPTIAVSAPVERRRETRISVNVKSGIARMGLEDTRVAPLDGRMIQFTSTFVELAFPRSELRHLRGRLERSFVALRLSLDPRTAVSCVARVRWTSMLNAEGSEADEMRLELEFMPMAPSDQERIAEAAGGPPSTPARPAA